MASAALPMLSSESGHGRYLDEIKRFPILESQQESMLAKRWREHDDRGAAHQLVTSHLRLVAKIAMGYRGYGLPMCEIVSEGNVGLMLAAERSEPERGFRPAMRCGGSRPRFAQASERRCLPERHVARAG
jgi:RNA polymerase sigma-32 factor